jgi:hypothetical protein
MSHDAEDVLHDKLRNNIFSVQVDKPTDFTNKSYVAAFVRFINGNEIKENFFFAESCLKQAKGKIYLMSCLHVWKQMVWENCVGICTDGIPSVVGSIRSFASLAKKEKKILSLPLHTASFTERCWFQKLLDMK